MISFYDQMVNIAVLMDLHLAVLFHFRHWVPKQVALLDSVLQPILQCRDGFYPLC